jgi:hypothetical protein
MGLEIDTAERSETPPDRFSKVWLSGSVGVKGGT